MSFLQQLNQHQEQLRYFVGFPPALEFESAAIFETEGLDFA